jgi:hypothetical protein
MCDMCEHDLNVVAEIDRVLKSDCSVVEGVFSSETLREVRLPIKRALEAVRVAKLDLVQNCCGC